MIHLTVVEAMAVPPQISMHLSLAQVSDGDGRVSGRRAVDEEECDSSTTLICEYM